MYSFGRLYSKEILTVYGQGIIVVLKKYDYVVFITLLAIITLQLVKLGNYPGLYLDAINPDYISVQLLHPQALETKWQIAWPWLCQIYHGNNGIIITLLSVLISGSTGVLQYHITYGIIAAAAVFLTYKILTHKILGMPAIWAFTGSLLLVSWPSVLTIIITQFYMCLFGTVCVLSGVLVFFRWMNDGTRLGRICLCYALFGIAFYSYFNFLFLLPSLLICTVIVLKKNNCLSTDSVMAPLLAYLLGCGFYIVGWSQIALWRSGVEITTVRMAELFFTVYTLLAAVFTFFCHKIKGRMQVLGYFIAGAFLWLIKIMPALRESTSGLGIIEDSSLWQKFAGVISDYSSILTGQSAEMMIFGNQVTVFNAHILPVFVSVVIATLAFEFVLKRFDVKWKIPVAAIAIYLCCCIPLGTRMQPQHYVPLVFITYLSFILCISRIFVCAGGSSKAILKFLSGLKVYILTVLVGCLIFANMFNEARIIGEIRETGGDGLWSSEMTKLADSAVINKEKGIKEVYVFQDWGFFTGFDYLTMNKIPFVTNMDENLLSRYYNEGNDIVACFWKEGDSSSYADAFERISNGQGSVVNKTWIDKNGRTEFYEIRLTKLGMMKN